MIPEIYFEDPFPINIPADDLADCYVGEGTDHSPKEWLEIWGKAVDGDPEDLENLRDLYIKMVDFYMEKNFDKQGLFAVVHDAYNIVKASGEDGNIRDFFDQYGIDFSHLMGNTKMDLQIIVIPFKNIEKLIKMKEQIGLSNTIQMWEDGAFVEV